MSRATWRLWKDAILRLPTIVWGYVLASLASGYAFGWLLIVPAIVVGLLKGESSGDAAFLLLSSLWICLYVSAGVAALALAPALIVIAVAEARRLSSARFYAIAGVVGANVCFVLLLALIQSGVLKRLGPPFVPQQLSSAGIEVPSVGNAIVAVVLLVVYLGCVGLIGCLVYWRIAGREAGEWLPEVARPPRPRARALPVRPESKP